MLLLWEGCSFVAHRLFNPEQTKLQKRMFDVCSFANVYSFILFARAAAPVDDDSKQSEGGTNLICYAAAAYDLALRE